MRESYCPVTSGVVNTNKGADGDIASQTPGKQVQTLTEVASSLTGGTHIHTNICVSHTRIYLFVLIFIDNVTSLTCTGC